MDRDEKRDKLKIKIADVIINLNLIEREIKTIIMLYTRSANETFVFDVLLNNLITTFNAKVKLLEYIIKDEKIIVCEDFSRALKIIMSKRNILAHSDSVIEDLEIIDFEWDHNSDGNHTSSPIYDIIEPSASTINNGSINTETTEKVIKDFEKYYDIALKELQKIERNMRFKYIVREFQSKKKS